MSATYDKDTPAGEVVRDLASKIEGKVILTTGVSPGGLGAFFVENVAKNSKPKLLILAGRSTAKLEKTQEALASTGVPTKLLPLDLGSLAGARAGAEAVNGWADVPVIDILVNNAGIMGVPYEKTEDGYEKQFATNHLAPFLFTNLIMSKIMASKKPRIVNVSSDGHRLGGVRFSDYNFHDGDSYDPWIAYGQSKSANILMAMSLAEKLGHKSLVAASLHPGVIGTNLSAHARTSDDASTEFFGALNQLDRKLGNAEGFRDFAFKDAERGCATHAYVAFSPDIKKNNGAYFLDSRLADPMHDTVKSWVVSSFEAERLWKLSEELVGQKFEY